MPLVTINIVYMETITLLFLATVSFINVIHVTPFIVREPMRDNPIFNKGRKLESMSAFFLKLNAESLRRNNHKLAKPSKPTLNNTPVCKHDDYFTKFSYFINVPVMHQFEKFKIIVVSAPPHVKFGATGNEPLVVYLIFNDETSDDAKSLSMPEVYFVTQKKGQVDFTMKTKNDQIWIINSNRTVTGLKSKDVAKFVDFRRIRRQPFVWTPITP